MDSIFAVTFGSDLDTLNVDDEARTFAAAVDDASEFTLLRYVNPFWKAMNSLNVGPEAELRDRIKVVDEFVYSRICARSEELTINNNSAQPGLVTMTRQDMLSIFMETTTTKTTTVDYKYLRDIVLSIVIAGKDTTSEALAWFFYMACKHPNVQERVWQEAGEATGVGEEDVSVDEFARSLTDEALVRMHYLHAALAETLRLYPPLPLVSTGSDRIGEEINTSY
ncbi:hypothetical protein HU200_054184 [Digitaria exilis]|uniref:Cytochrome P450 n=1 Tax=Digitaria exilis TaxID=1010633 RepID=A0A835AQ81_9POAL|nr:hypothetical protein HU200_054184 [Digitaria exilis]